VLYVLYRFSVYYFVFVCILVFNFFCSLFLQYFDTVGWVFRPVKIVSHITYHRFFYTTACCYRTSHDTVLVGM